MPTLGPKQHNKCLIVLAALVKPTKLLRLQGKTTEKTTEEREAQEPKKKIAAQKYTHT